MRAHFEPVSARASEQRSVRSGSHDDVAFLLGNAGSVIIVPGYRLAGGARAARGEGDGPEAEQQGRPGALRHPPGGRPHARLYERVAGEAEVSYDQVLETGSVNKRSMASRHAGIDNPLFYMDETMMVFGDAKKVVEDIKAIE